MRDKIKTAAVIVGTVALGLGFGYVMYAANQELYGDDRCMLPGVNCVIVIQK